MKALAYVSSAFHRGDRRSPAVPRWVIGCSACGQEFTHSEIDPEQRSPMLDPFSWIGDKPELPEKGVSLKCPHCKKVSVYKRYQLTYRAT
jgi:hypothetical protein